MCKPWVRFRTFQEAPGKSNHMSSMRTINKLGKLGKQNRKYMISVRLCIKEINALTQRKKAMKLNPCTVFEYVNKAKLGNKSILMAHFTISATTLSEMIEKVVPRGGIFLRKKSSTSAHPYYTAWEYHPGTIEAADIEIEDLIKKLRQKGRFWVAKQIEIRWNGEI